MSKPLSDLFIRPDYDHSRIAVTFTAPSGCTRASWKVLDDGNTILTGALDAEPGEEASFEAAVPNAKPWNVNTPHLYTLKLTLTIDGAEVEHAEDFGLRKIHITEEALYVNNERFYVRGYIRGREAHDHPNLEDLPLEEYYAKNIRMAKRYGFNFIRFHSRVPPVECFRAADRMGIFIHVELRKYYGKYQKERSLMDEGKLLDEGDWTAEVLRIRNHSSLMVYCMGNEIDHPGRNPRCRHFYDLTRKLDPTRLFLDTCSRGEFDRQSVDLDVQHMGYFYPFGENYGMFDDTRNWVISGSATGLPMIERDGQDDYTYKLTRRVPSPRPVLAHEVCHYVGLRDVRALQEKFQRTGAEKPWWLDELDKLIKLKGHEESYPLLLEASRRFQLLSWKLTLEAARRSTVLSGFHFLQLSDTDRYENANGVIDCFDDPKGVDAEEFLKFNGDTVVLADLPRRTYYEGERVTVPVVLSHFSFEMAGMADFAFELRSKDSNAVRIAGRLEQIDFDERGRREICQLTLRMPTIARPESLTLRFSLDARDGSQQVENSWNVWLYPDRPEELPGPPATVDLGDVRPAARYPQIQNTATSDGPARLMIVHRFTDAVLKHLAAGGDVLMLYRVPVTRDRKLRAPKEKYYLPAAWDRFKGTMWDRGHNCGAFVRESHALDGFPNDGFCDLQFHALIDGADKICLDDFPVRVDPIVEGVDKAVRDRFDVFNFKLANPQPAYTMRRFAYLFELRVGPGRLLVSGLNFTKLGAAPEAAAMFESLVRYVTSDAFGPEAEMSVDALEKYLLEKGAAPFLKERRMTQFWQLDEEPLESKDYWAESLAYLDEEPLVGDIWMRELEQKNEPTGDEAGATE